MRRISFVVLLLCSLSAAQVPQSFFAMSTASVLDMPKVPYGTLGHPGVFAWTAIEGTARGTYNFQNIDAYVKRAPQVNGVAQIDLTLGYTPGWAVADQSTCRSISGGVIACTAPPDNIQDWIDFVTQLIGHYNGVSAPHVAIYEIWNEANLTTFWSGTVSQLAALGAAAYPILKSDPNSRVLTPSVVWATGTGPSFTESYLALAPADGVSFHAYTCKTLKTPGKCLMPESTKITQSTNAPLQTMIAAFQGIGQPVYVTEGGWGLLGVTDPDLQEAWIAHYFIVGASYGLMLENWFEWGVPTKALSGNIEQSNGQPTGAGLAYGVVTGWLQGQTAKVCSGNSTIWSCPVGSNVIVWNTSQTCLNGVCTTKPYSVVGFSSYTDLTGAKRQIQNGSINLGIKPVLLQP
jgi:hypothetical protein